MFIILGLILVLGVGYAVVSSVSLSITGSATGESRDLDVYFNGTKSVSNASKGTATVTSGSKTATFTASNMALDETITFSYTVLNNESDVAAVVTLSTTGSNDYFTVSVSPTSTTINPGNSTSVVVSVTMVKTPIDSSNNNADFTVNISAVPALYDSSSSSGSTVCCFDPNMRVLMADGTYKKIVDVKVGDMVMSLSEKNW